MKTSCLIVEGGGFKTGFTAGVLDAFMSGSYKPFQKYIGVSGGSIAMSYFLSNQYRLCISAMKLLAVDEHFTNFKRTLGEQGYMDIDFLAKVAGERVPLDLEKALKESKNHDIYFVATNRKNGQAEYLKPNKQNWIDSLIASSTLPFVTKGKHFINGVEYFDGGWSDPLPVKWAYEQGAKEILVLRTWPKGQRSSQSWVDYLGSLYFKTSPHLKDTFSNCHKKYNESVDFIENPPDDLIIEEIAPIKLLKSGTYSYSPKTLMSDYRYGLDRGLMYIHEKMNRLQQ
ncbi:MAG: putative patatin/cPLA2 family phospholipase [Saprospiraceae bacterium]|jgi:predicted patatin/cPLA2 family phospholipase